jgi:galactokinase
MIGGGFGGSVLALVPAAASAAGGGAGSGPVADRGSDPVRDAVTAAFARNGWTAPEFLDSVPSDSARQISG